MSRVPTIKDTQRDNIAIESKHYGTADDAITVSKITPHNDADQRHGVSVIVCTAHKSDAKHTTGDILAEEYWYEDKKFYRQTYAKGQKQIGYIIEDGTEWYPAQDVEATPDAIETLKLVVENILGYTVSNSTGSAASGTKQAEAALAVLKILGYEVTQDKPQPQTGSNGFQPEL